MTDHRINEHGQPIGLPAEGSFPRPFPPHKPLQGRTVRLEPTRPEHAAALYEALIKDESGRNWTYLPGSPLTSLEDAQKWVETCAASRDPQFYTLCNADGVPVGIASYLRIDPANGVIEVGHIHFSPALQRSAAATEAMYLMMRNAFDELGYRRYEWKCDALNAPSRKAAERLGFTYEGTFRQSVVTKGRNRDTAWFSVLDSEWPKLKARFDAWLSPTNFGADGQQITRLNDF
ncbi:GNAT family N-acetyltransferase [Alloyangia pacifica]|uniref:GNAT family N-acetyltransferase n=1 Tax=Alloyangia pacifica TaxID=311180 RepID=UPI001CD7BDB3|nr:GNAT family protein [Alloyangia pacifica]MCA0994043.1 GNAT family N-acetyltransferase [Alloyangia pacifica]